MEPKLGSPSSPVQGGAARSVQDTDDGRLRVCQVCSAHLATDGRVFERACVTLARNGYEVHLLAVGREGAAYQAEGVTVHPLPPWRSSAQRLRRRQRVAALAAALEPDLFHVHEPELLGPVIARARGRPVIWDVHEAYLEVLAARRWLPQPLRPLARLLWNRSERRLLRRCAAVLPATEAVAARYRPLHPRVRVIANYPDLSLLEAIPRGERRGAACVFTGVIGPNRGILQLIDALGLLARSGLPVPLDLAGRTSDAFLARVRKRAEEAGVGDLARYHGCLPHQEALALSARASIGVVPHLPYGNNLAAWPVKMLEFMALGLPLVFSDLPSHREVAGQAGAGIAVDATDPASIAAGIRQLVEDPERARQLGEAGRRAALERFNWEAESKHLLAVYAEVARIAAAGAGSARFPEGD